MIKYGKAKVLEIGEVSNFLKENDRVEYSLKKLASENSIFRPILLDPARYIYLRNRAISAVEYHGPNDNGDGFPEAELRKSYGTFIGKPVTLDHKPILKIGIVLDSAYIEPVDPSDPRTGHFVENIWAIDKILLQKRDPRLLHYILDRKITDTSMGVKVGRSVCSACGNVARVESEYCEHIKYSKLKTIKVGSKYVKVYEECYDLEFIEDSLIRPLELQGLAGGRGADRNAKILEIFSVLESFKKSAADYKPDINKYVQTQKTDYKDIWADPNKPMGKEEAGNEPQEEPTRDEFMANIDTYQKEKYKIFQSLESNKPTVRIDEIPNLFSALPSDTMKEIYNQVIKLFSSVMEKVGTEKDQSLKDLFDEFVTMIKNTNVPFYVALLNIYDKYLHGEGDLLSTKQDIDKTPISIEVPDDYDFTKIPEETAPELEHIDIQELDEFEPINIQMPEESKGTEKQLVEDIKVEEKEKEDTTDSKEKKIDDILPLIEELRQKFDEYIKEMENIVEDVSSSVQEKTMYTDVEEEDLDDFSLDFEEIDLEEEAYPKKRVRRVRFWL